MIVNKALSNGWDNNYIDMSYNDFFLDINAFIKRICYDQSEVLIGGLNVITNIMKLNNIYFDQITHVSRDKYLDIPYAFVINKNTNRIIKKQFQKM